METRRGVRTLAALLALLVALAGWPAISWAQDRPDLQIEYAGFSPPHLTHTVTFKVTNVGKAKSSETTAKIVTIKPPSAIAAEPEVKSLEPGESEVLFYGLSGDGCNGHEVDATVNDPLDLNGTNDHVRITACDEKPGPQTEPAPKPAPASKPAPGGTGLGEQTLTLQPTLTKSVVACRDSGGINKATDCSWLSEDAARVGWGQVEQGPLLGDRVSVAETAVLFDLSAVEQNPRKFVTKAVLAYEEQGFEWEDGEGNPQLKPGCVAVLGLATVDWTRSGGVRAQFPNRTLMTAPSGSTREWNVTDDVNRQLGEDPSSRHGYVLRGAMNFQDLTGDDDTKCISYVHNIHLDVTVSDVPPAGPPDLALEKIGGKEELEVPAGTTVAYLVNMRNDGADAAGTVVVDIATSGVLTLAEQTEVVRPGWEANGFTCVATPPSGGANAGLRCTGGSLKQGERTNPAILVQVTRPGFGYIHASIGVSGGPPDKNPSGNDFTLGVRVY